MNFHDLMNNIHKCMHMKLNMPYKARFTYVEHISNAYERYRCQYVAHIVAQKLATCSFTSCGVFAYD